MSPPPQSQGPGYAPEKRDAVRLVEELDILDSGKYHEEDRIAKVFEECEIDPTCSFEPKSQSKKRKRGRPKKRLVYMMTLNQSHLLRKTTATRIKGLEG